MKTVMQKIFFGKGVYLLLGEFLLLAVLVAKYYWFNELNIDDGKPLFNLTLVTLCITGGSICLIRMRQWGGYRSRIGKILLFYSIGFFAWAIGTTIWAYEFIFLRISIPFPGWPDLAYIFINPSWIIGFGLFGYTIALRDQKNDAQQKIYFSFIPICMALVTFYFIYTLGHGTAVSSDDTLKMLLNFYYTGGNIVVLVVLLIFGGTKYNYLGERLRMPFTLALVSIAFSYIADTLYSYTTSVGTYVNGGITDFFYTLLLTTLGLAAYTLHPRLLEDKQ